MRKLYEAAEKWMTETSNLSSRKKASEAPLLLAKSYTTVVPARIAEQIAPVIR